MLGRISSPIPQRESVRGSTSVDVALEIRRRELRDATLSAVPTPSATPGA